MQLWGRKKRRKQLKDTGNPKLVLIRQIVLGVLLFALIGLLGVGVWYGSRVASLTIVDVEVIGGETIAHDTLTEIAHETLEGMYYRLVPRRFAWTYPKDTIESRIGEIERIKNVHVERTSGTSITIIFEEYIPFGLWCTAEQAEEVTPSACFFVDKNGFSFTEAPKLQGGAFLRFSEPGRTPERSVVAFDGDFIQNTESFIDRVYDELALNIVQVDKTAPEELTYHIAGGGQLKVSLRMDADETIDNLATILASDAFDHIEPGNFQYIDLRYGNKIFVNEELPSTPVDGAATSTATSSENDL